MTQSLHSSPASPKLGLFGAITLGVASMLGAGVFIVFAPAASLAGNQLFFALLIAAIVAGLNARSMMQLSKTTSEAGGAYAYARKHLSSGFGFLAGFAFVVGKIGSASSVALVIGNYVLESNPKPVAILAILAMAAINLLGINRTALGATVLAVVTVSFLGLLIAVSPTFSIDKFPAAESFDLLGIFQAAALIFFAFAGYARIATLGSEVTNPTKNIPLAIFWALTFTLLLYFALAITLQTNLGSNLESSNAPVADLAALSAPWLPAQVVSVVAGIAALGSLLALLAGISRTASAMGTDGELPRILGLRSKRRNVPFVAELIVSGLAILLLLFGDLVFTIGLSSFAVLLYYAIANLSAYKEAAKLRQKLLSLLGLFACLSLVVLVPETSLMAGVLLLCTGLLVRSGLKALQARR